MPRASLSLSLTGAPRPEIGSPDLGGLFEIWEDAAVGALTPSAHEDLGTTRPVLGPRKGNFQVRWFVISPLPEGVPKPVFLTFLSWEGVFLVFFFTVCST